MEETLLEAEMIRIQLSQEAREELESFRRQASSKDSEKALMILMNSEGQSVPKIARILKRNPHTRNGNPKLTHCGNPILTHP